VLFHKLFKQRNLPNGNTTRWNHYKMKQNGVLEWFQNKCSGKFEGLNTKEIDKYFIVVKVKSAHLT